MRSRKGDAAVQERNQFKSVTEAKKSSAKIYEMFLAYSKVEGARQGEGDAAAVYYERYVTAQQHPEYVRQKKQHQERHEGKK